MQYEVFGVSVEFRARVSRKRGFFETTRFGLHCGVWCVDYASRQGYKVFVVTVPWER
jgi:hypothetical protein